MKEKVFNFIKNYKYQLLILIVPFILLSIIFFLSGGIISTSGDEFSQYRTFYITIIKHLKEGNLNFYLENVFNGQSLSSFYYYIPLDPIGLLKIGLGLIMPFDTANFLINVIVFTFSSYAFFKLLNTMKIKEKYKLYFAFVYAFLSFGTFVQYPNFFTMELYFVLFLLILKHFYKRNNKVFYPLTYVISFCIALSNIYMAFVTFFSINVFVLGAKLFFEFNKDNYKKEIKEILLTLLKIDIVFLLATFTSFICNGVFLTSVFKDSVKRGDISYLFIYPLDMSLFVFLKSLFLAPINKDEFLTPEANYVFYQGTLYIGVLSSYILANIFLTKNIDKKKYILTFIVQFLLIATPLFSLMSNAFTNYYFRWCLFLNTFNIFLLIKILTETGGEVLLLKKENFYKSLLVTLIYLIGLLISYFIIKNFAVNKDTRFVFVLACTLLISLLYNVIKEKAVYIEIIASVLVLFQQSYTNSHSMKDAMDKEISRLDTFTQSAQKVLNFGDDTKFKLNYKDDNGLIQEVVTAKYNYITKDRYSFASFSNANIGLYNDFINSGFVNKKNWTQVSTGFDSLDTFYEGSSYLIAKKYPFANYEASPFYEKVFEDENFIMYEVKYHNDVFYLNKSKINNNEKYFALDYLNFSTDRLDYVYKNVTSSIRQGRLNKFVLDDDYKTTLSAYRLDFEGADDDFRSKYVTFDFAQIVRVQNDVSLFIKHIDDTFTRSLDLSFIYDDTIKDVYIVTTSDLNETVLEKDIAYISAYDLNDVVSTLDYQLERNKDVEVTVKNDVVSVKYFDKSVKDNVVVSSPYLYDRGFVDSRLKETFGMMSFDYDGVSFTSDYVVHGQKEGAVVSVVALSLSVLSYIAYLTYDYKKNNKKFNLIGKKVIDIEIN